MSEKTHPTVSRIVRTAVFAAGIAIAVYATDLIVKQYQKHKAEERRRQAQSLLAETVAALKKRLPPPESPDLADKMPQDFSPYLRWQVLYYPRINITPEASLPDCDPLVRHQTTFPICWNAAVFGLKRKTDAGGALQA